MTVSVLTLFPEILKAPLKASLLGKAIQRGLLRVRLIQIRDFATDKHHTVDDKPYGGGDGMLLRADVLHAAWKKARGKAGAHTVLLSPQGKLWSQQNAKQLWRVLSPATSAAAAVSGPSSHLILVCGHYEGVDERFIDHCVDEEISVGDYVLTGGEVPALVLIDTLARLIPGVVGKEGSVSGDSLEGGLLKYPQYTRPAEFEGRGVPEILTSGDHGKIAQWRRAQSEARTVRKRPDLLSADGALK